MPGGFGRAEAGGPERFFVDGFVGEVGVRRDRERRAVRRPAGGDAAIERDGAVSTWRELGVLSRQ
jgi:hypothetical protein